VVPQPVTDRDGAAAAVAEYARRFGLGGRRGEIVLSADEPVPDWIEALAPARRAGGFDFYAAPAAADRPEGG
jgi:hypothetical protein